MIATLSVLFDGWYIDLTRSPTHISSFVLRSPFLRLNIVESWVCVSVNGECDGGLGLGFGF